MNTMGTKDFPQPARKMIFTSAAALENARRELSVQNDRFLFWEISNGNLDGDFYITSNGDPTLGTCRYENYKPENFKQQLLDAIKKSGIKKISGHLIIDDSYFDFQGQPPGVLWKSK